MKEDVSVTAIYSPYNLIGKNIYIFITRTKYFDRIKSFTCLCLKIFEKLSTLEKILQELNIGYLQYLRIEAKRKLKFLHVSRFLFLLFDIQHYIFKIQHASFDQKKMAHEIFNFQKKCYSYKEEIININISFLFWRKKVKTKFSSFWIFSRSQFHQQELFLVQEMF